MFPRRRICAHFRDAVSTDTATRSDTLPRTWLRGYDRRGRSLVISIGGAGQRITERATEAEGNNEGGGLVGREEDWERVTRAIAHTWGVQKSAREELALLLDAVRGRESQGDRVAASRRDDSARHGSWRNEIPRYDRTQRFYRDIYCTPHNIFLNDFISREHITIWWSSSYTFKSLSYNLSLLFYTRKERFYCSI